MSDIVQLPDAFDKLLVCFGYISVFGELFAAGINSAPNSNKSPQRLEIQCLRALAAVSGQFQLRCAQKVKYPVCFGYISGW